MAAEEGRIVKAVSGFYDVDTTSGVVRCRARGVFKKRGVKPLVGDLVLFSRSGTTEGVIDEIRLRRSEMVRPPVANVDQVLLVVALADPPPSLYQMDKMLAMIEWTALPASIVLTKLDLPDAPREWRRIREIYEPLSYSLMPVSLRAEIGVEALKKSLPGKVSVLMGQSGVGKSTILRHLIPDAAVAIGEVSERSRRGRQTTTHVELYRHGDGFVGDTPGFSQFDLWSVEPAQLTGLFRDIAAVAPGCEFRGCLHEGEDGCAVRSAAGGAIAAARYADYLQVLHELKEAKARRY